MSRIFRRIEKNLESSDDVIFKHVLRIHNQQENYFANQTLKKMKGMFVKIMRNITILFHNNQQKIISMKHTKNKEQNTVIKETKHRSTVRNQQRTHHCSERKKIMRRQRKHHNSLEIRMSKGRQDDCNLGHKNQAVIHPVNGRPRVYLNRYKNRGNLNNTSNSSITQNLVHEEIFISLVQRTMLSPFLSPSLRSFSVHGVHEEIFISPVQHTMLSPLPSPSLPSFSVHNSRIPSLPSNNDSLSQHKAYLSIPAYHMPLPPFRPFALTVITRLQPHSFTVIHKNKATCRKNKTQEARKNKEQ